MHFLFALVAGALVLQTSAFLIPPGVSSAGEAAKGQLEALWMSQMYTYDIDCPGCPFAGSVEGEIQWEENVENTLHLEILIDENQMLRINSVVVFPLDFSKPLEFNVGVSQTRTADLQTSEPIPVGFALEVSPQDSNHEEPDKRLLRAKFTIVDLKGIPVEVDTVEIMILEIVSESRTSRYIVKVSSVPFDQSPGADTCAGSATWSLCRLRAILMGRLQGIVGDARARAEAAHAWLKKPNCHGAKVNNEDGGHHYRPEGGRHHKQRQLHHLLHRVGHVIHQAIRFFIVPALLGVIGGLMASAVGMLVGQIIVYSWLRFHRNGQRGQVRLVEVPVVESEKEAFLDPPPYYDDVKERVVEDQKQ